jgi:hypothetical protein
MSFAAVVAVVGHRFVVLEREESWRDVTADRHECAR